MLLPILCILCVMPFVVYLAEYDYGYSSYLWHSDNSVAQDLYAYYRSYFFALTAIVSVFVLAFRMGLYREKNKPGKIFLSLAVYSICVVLSTVCFRQFPGFPYRKFLSVSKRVCAAGICPDGVLCLSGDGKGAGLPDCYEGNYRYVCLAQCGRLVSGIWL